MTKKGYPLCLSIIACIMTHKPELSVVIPAYNEAERIGLTIQQISNHLNKSRIAHEIIVVSDGSTDSTIDIVRHLAEHDSRIRLIGYDRNQGKGYAVRTGTIAAESENVLLTDADLATPIEELHKLQKVAENGFEVVVGSRALSDSKIVGWRPWYRVLSGKVFNAIVRLSAVPGIHDTQCGFKLFTCGSAARIFASAKLDGFGFDVEALFLARKYGYRVSEIGVLWNNSPSTKVSVFRDTLPMLWEVLKIRMNDWKKHYESSRSTD